MRSVFRLSLIALSLLVSLSVHAADDADSSRTSTFRPTKSDYVLQPGDLIKVQVFQEEDINRQGEVRVSQEYTVILPLIGKINLSGKTARAAEELIRTLYDRDYIVNPQVNVTVLEYAPRFVKVFGAVGKPGIVAFPQEEGMTLLEAISRADGFSRLANKRQVTLARMNADGRNETVTINADEAIKGGAADVPLQPDDIINVPERIL